jgi:hypothetical protein
MQIKLKSENLYRTSKACALAGISRGTFLRWVRDGFFVDVELRDWRNWRLFTDIDVIRLRSKASAMKSLDSAICKAID